MNHPRAFQRADHSMLRMVDFSEHITIQTRWADNDMYGHLNNAVYYQLFDTAINAPLLRLFPEPAAEAGTIRVVASSSCTFLSEAGFPSPMDIGTRVTRLGRSSVTYQCALFVGTGYAAPIAVGEWVHVYLDRATRSSCPIPPKVRTYLESQTSEGALA